MTVRSTEHILLNEDADGPATVQATIQATIIVIGVSEPAANRVLAVLRAGGLPIHAGTVKGTSLSGRPPALFGRWWLGGSAASAYVRARNAEAPRWVLHAPGAADVLGARGFASFRAPRLIVLTRDPIAIAETMEPSATPFVQRLRAATRGIDRILDVARKAACPVLLLSHAEVMRADSGFAELVRAFGGLEPDPAGVANCDGEGGVDPAASGAGLVVVPTSTRRKPTAGPRTIVIGGPPRSGTSMVAAALYAGGLPLGENLLPSTFENVLHNALFRPQNDKKNWKGALLRPRYFRLIRDGFDVEAIKKLVTDRRRDGPIWGFKRPGIHEFITHGGLALLENPSVVMSFRDPLPMAKRIAQAHALDMPIALAWAQREIVASLETALTCDVPTFLVSYDVARRDFSGFLTRLYAFCELQVDPARYAEIDAFAKQSGEKYLRQFAGPSVGEISGLVKGVLRGWASRRLQGEGVRVDVYADDRKVASVVADREQGHGRLGFRCRLDRRPLPETARITAFVAATKTELDYSGLTIAELRRGLVRLGNRAMSEEIEGAN